MKSVLTDAIFRLYEARQEAKRQRSIIADETWKLRYAEDELQTCNRRIDEALGVIASKTSAKAFEEFMEQEDESAVLP